MIANITTQNETSQTNKEQILNWLLSENFLRVLVKNLTSAKNLLNGVSVEVKTSLVALLNSMEISSELALDLLKTLFGPNTMKKLAMRRN